MRFVRPRFIMAFALVLFVILPLMRAQIIAFPPPTVMAAPPAYRLGGQLEIRFREPACVYGYFATYPYACVPHCYYGPSWFVNGLFIGNGPWYRHRYYRGLYRRVYPARQFDRSSYGWSGSARHAYRR